MTDKAQRVIRRHFKVDRTKTPAELFASCGHKSTHIDDQILATMPMDDGPEEGYLVFFPLERRVSNVEIVKILDDQGLVPDYAAQMQVNADDLTFANEHPNGMVWEDDTFVFFHRSDVYVRRVNRGWDVGWWFAGRPKT